MISLPGILLQRRDYHVYALGWMYRSSDLVAAFGRAQLTKLDHYLEVQREHGAALIALPAIIR